MTRIKKCMYVAYGIRRWKSDFGNRLDFNVVVAAVIIFILINSNSLQHIKRSSIISLVFFECRKRSSDVGFFLLSSVYDWFNNQHTARASVFHLFLVLWFVYSVIFSFWFHSLRFQFWTTILEYNNHGTQTQWI